MRTIIKTTLLTVFFNVFLLIGLVYTTPPMPGRIYNPDREYKAIGKPIPKLRKGKIAKVGREYIKESDYLKWLGSKIERGLLFREFVFDVLVQQKARELGIKIGQKDMDLLVNKKVDEEMKSLKDKVDETEKAQIRERKRRMYLRNLLPALIVYKEWDIPVDETMTEETKKEIAYDVAVRELAKLEKELIKEAKITMSGYESSVIAVVNGQKITEEDYGRWIFSNVNTARFLENYISKLLFEKKAKKLGIKVSKEDIEITRERRRSDMLKKMKEEDVDGSQELKDDEIRLDLYASRIIYRNREITEKEIENRFFEKYGENGMKYKIKHIFKRIKKKYLKKGDTKYDKALKEMGKVTRERIEKIYKRIQKEGAENFRIIAQQESEDIQTRDSGGYIGEFVKSRGGEFDEVVPALKEGEISGILKSKSDFHIVKIDRKEGKKLYISHILARKFYKAIEDDVAWKENKKEFMKEMKELLKRAKSGEDFEKLAEENSDDYSKIYGCDISDTWERRYRTKFGEQLISFKKGDMGIIESYYGLHIVKFEDITITGYTDELKEKLRDEIRSGVAPVQEIVTLAVKLMREAKAYYTQ